MPVKNIEVIPNSSAGHCQEMTEDEGWRPHHIVVGIQNPGTPGLPGRCPSQSTISTCQDICRICHCEGDGGADNALVAPCYCSGSLRWVHQQCLQQWIKSSDIKCCELCKFQFVMQSKLKAFNQWEGLQMTPLEKRKLLCSVTFHAIALTCVAWSLYVLIDRTTEELERGMLEWPFWTKLIVVAIGFSGSVVFMYIQCKAYANLCRRWKAYNRVIYIQNAPEKTALPPDSPKPEADIQICLPSFKLSPANCGSVLPVQMQMADKALPKMAICKDNQGCESNCDVIPGGKRLVASGETVSSDEGETHGLLNI